MTNTEIKELMLEGKKTTNISKYMIIYKQATGKPWTDCLCGGGFMRLFNTCLYYSKTLKE